MVATGSRTASDDEGTPAFLERTLFRDPAHEMVLRTRGYVVVDLLGPDEVAELRSFYVAHADRGDLNPEGAYNEEYGEFTIMNSRNDFRREAFEIIDRIVTPRAAEHLIDVQPVIANFVNKPPGGGLVPVHQNISIVEEDSARSVSVWIALVDITEANGPLQFVDGTHLHLRGPRGPWAYTEFLEIDHDTIDRRFTTMPIRAGQAIILDDAVVHYSPPNRSSERRLAIQLVMGPAELPTTYYECTGEDDDQLFLDRLAIGPAYFFDFWHGSGDRSHAELLEQLVIPRARYDATSLDPPAAVEPEPETAGPVRAQRTRAWSALRRTITRRR